MRPEDDNCRAARCRSSTYLVHCVSGCSWSPAVLVVGGWSRWKRVVATFTLSSLVSLSPTQVQPDSLRQARGVPITRPVHSDHVLASTSSWLCRLLLFFSSQWHHFWLTLLTSARQQSPNWSYVTLTVSSCPLPAGRLHVTASAQKRYDAITGHHRRRQTHGAWNLCNPPHHFILPSLQFGELVGSEGMKSISLVNHFCACWT
jgi:hypothetical protein